MHEYTTHKATPMPESQGDGACEAHCHLVQRARSSGVVRLCWPGTAE